MTVVVLSAVLQSSPLGRPECIPAKRPMSDVPQSKSPRAFRKYSLTDKTEVVVDLSFQLFRKIHIRCKWGDHRRVPPLCSHPHYYLKLNLTLIDNDFEKTVNDRKLTISDIELGTRLHIHWSNVFT